VNAEEGAIDEQVDWALGKCSVFDTSYTHFVHYARYNKKVHKRALASVPSKKKPMIINFISVDSFSRRHFFRKLEKTVDFLNKLNSEGDYGVFDFKLHNVIGGDTSENLSMVLGHRFLGKHHSDDPKDRYKKEAMWYKMKELGFATQFGTDACPFKLYKLFGIHPEADHVSNSFFCANYKFADYKSAKRVKRE
jgi:hypothetical protein